MRIHLKAISAAAFCALSSHALAASQPIKFLPGQTIYACPKTMTQPAGGVCNANVLVGGGAPASGYTFTVQSGFTLPAGVFLTAATGVITRSGANSRLPAAGAVKKIHITVSDGSKSANGTVTFQMQGSGGVCGCGVFQVVAGPIPLPAVANQPYAVTLSVVGPPSGQALRPNYNWKVRAGSTLPPGLVLDAARGVLRGTPTAAAKGKTYNFFVDVKETKTGQTAISSNQYSLRVN